MNSRRILLLYAALLLALASGCATTVGRKAKGVFYGSSGIVHPLVLEGKTAAEYPYVIVERFTTELKGADDLLGKIHANLIPLINNNDDLNKKAYVAGTAVPGSPALRIEGELLDLSEGDKLRRATTTGGEAYIIMRYTVKDARTGETLAVFNSAGFIGGNIGISGKMDDIIPILNWSVIRYLEGELR
jgi:hypothetical protein